MKTHQSPITSHQSSIINLLILLLICVAACAPNLELKKRQEEAARNLGEVYYGQKDYTSALREFLKAESIYAEDPYLQNDLGLTYMAKGKPELAIERFKKAIGLNPDYAPARNNLGLAYIAVKDWDSAIAAFKEVTEDLLYATPHYPLSNLGLVCYNKGEYELAEQYYQQSLKLSPNFVTALIGLGRTFIAMGKISQAIETLEKAVEQAPRFGANYFYLAKAYTLSRNYKKAVHYYRMVIELAPGSQLAEEAEKAIQQGG